jgi:hypothetical protein
MTSSKEFLGSKAWNYFWIAADKSRKEEFWVLMLGRRSLASNLTSKKLKNRFKIFNLNQAAMITDLISVSAIHYFKVQSALQTDT